jgi:biopolymer transport protein ExbB/TolQ
VKVKEDRRNVTFGRIDGNIFKYVTLPMIFVLGMIAWAVVAAFSSLLPYYETNVLLNGLIISFMIYGILKTFYNCYLLYKTARFFRLMETITRQDNVPQSDIKRLRLCLEKDGELVNTITMAETIDNIEKFGHPNFNDHRARMIKSKMGFRVSKKQGNISYIAGILVMLGLLGTFLGLLATIDAVGEALGGMANIGGGGNIGVEDMSNFIGSLAKPLGGMGLAFSSSLFGLSGSLLIGFFLYLAGTPQNSFMENISRWIDDRIPVHKPAQAKVVQDAKKLAESDKNEAAVDVGLKAQSQDKLAKINPPVKDQDLKDWLSGYIYMSVKVNNLVKDLCSELSVTTQEIQKVTKDNEAIRQAHTGLVEGVKSTNIILENIQGYNLTMSKSLPTMMENGHALIAETKKIHNLQVSGMDTLIKMHANIDNITSFTEENKAIAAQINQNSKYVSELIDKSNKQAESSVRVHDDVLTVLKSLKDISEGSRQAETEIVALEKENLRHLSTGFNEMQSSLNDISAHIVDVHKKTTAQQTPEDIRSIKGFVAELSGLQKDLVKSIQQLSQEVAKNQFGKINEGLIEKIERKISSFEEKLKSFLKK